MSWNLEYNCWWTITENSNLEAGPLVPLNVAWVLALAAICKVLKAIYQRDNSLFDCSWTNGGLDGVKYVCASTRIEIIVEVQRERSREEQRGEELQPNLWRR